LRRGLRPPASGLRHHHGWSDGLAMRAAPYGLLAAGDPAEAARLVAEDGAVSHSGEGVLGGRAVAAGVAAAAAGAAPGGVLAAALDAVPEDSWTARNLNAAEEAVRTAAPPAGGAPPAGDFQRALHAALVTPHYPWTDLAPEAGGLAFAAFLAAGGEVGGAVTTAAHLGRDADTTPAPCPGRPAAPPGCRSAGPRRSARSAAPACPRSPDATSSRPPTCSPPGIGPSTGGPPDDGAARDARGPVRRRGRAPGRSGRW